jgi:ubiquinone/menaquinone biosynthesis C-methylase UbiE
VKSEAPDYRHIEETYDEGSQDYGDYFKKPHEFIEQDRHQFIARLPAGSKILDCGCGPGMDTEKFSQLGYDVTAIDLSDRFVKLTRKRIPNAIVQKMDMRYLAFPEAAFDGVWASFSLLHIRANEIRKTLFGFRFVLRERGLGLLTSDNQLPDSRQPFRNRSTQGQGFGSMPTRSLTADRIRCLQPRYRSAAPAVWFGVFGVCFGPKLVLFMRNS